MGTPTAALQVHHMRLWPNDLQPQPSPPHRSAALTQEAARSTNRLQFSSCSQTRSRKNSLPAAASECHWHRHMLQADHSDRNKTYMHTCTMVRPAAAGPTCSTAPAAPRLRAHHQTGTRAGRARLAARQVPPRSAARPLASAPRTATCGGEGNMQSAGNTETAAMVRPPAVTGLRCPPGTPPGRLPAPSRAPGEVDRLPVPLAQQAHVGHAQRERRRCQQGRLARSIAQQARLLGCDAAHHIKGGGGEPQEEQLRGPEAAAGGTPRWRAPAMPACCSWPGARAAPGSRSAAAQHPAAAPARPGCPGRSSSAAPRSPGRAAAAREEWQGICLGWTMPVPCHAAAGRSRRRRQQSQLPAAPQA